ncbi:Retrovirus-related Pol polyprotein from transposon TNT 1-94 [Araneus ventricosus]|uniref:Retrovirus-related Pol polyprotein from transposon TNT 1-94 n=1 Tax=Araneus ventricosus TaxID=182803 RepID=A0A4Y2R3E6_ARAVE|nr:Retrovirus-related Pol polyprotein from transposon TNT 1-94 [Araneus ventricosus]
MSKLPISRKVFYSELSSKLVNPEAQCTSTSQKVGEWLIDRAATSHFCNNRDWLSTFRHVTKTEVLVGDENCASRVNFIGNIVLNVKDGLGIKMERTSVYTPEQNGVAERFNRTAVEGIRSMLQDSGLKTQFWAEALLASVHVKNRCVHKLTGNKTPIEIWTGYRPSVRHFRIFGSLAHVYIPSLRLNKLQPKADVGIMIGYGIKTRGYRVWVPTQKRVIETTRVSINEHKNGVKHLYGKPRLRSLNNVKKYCDKENTKFEPDMFSFKPLNLDQHYNSRDENSNDSFNESLSDDEANIFQEEIYNLELPKSFENTRKSPERKLWEEAMKSELKIMHDRNVWTLVDPPDKSRILDCRRVYTVETNHTDRSKTFKARLVSRGFNQIAGVDYSDVFSPVVNFSVIRFMFILFGTSLCFNSGYTGKAISIWVDLLNPSHWPVDALSIVQPHEDNVTGLQRLTFYSRLLYKLAEMLLSKPAPQLLSKQCHSRIFSLLESTRSKSGTPVCLRSCKNKEVEQVLIALRFYAVAIADLFKVSQPTVSRVVHRVSEAMASLLPDYIYLPVNKEECIEVSKKFFDIAGFSSVIGALDCTFVNIVSPGGEDAERFRCRKNYFALNVQTIVDSDLVIRNVVARWPGRDSGYGLEKYLLTPFGNPRSPAEVRYNKSHVLTRNTVERKYGILKRRFPCLSIGLNCHIERVPAIIVACCVLHNLAIRLGAEPAGLPTGKRLLPLVIWADRLAIEVGCTRIAAPLLRFNGMLLPAVCKKVSQLPDDFTFFIRFKNLLSPLKDDLYVSSLCDISLKISHRSRFLFYSYP